LEGAILTLQIHAFSLDFTYTRPALAALLVVSAITMLAAIRGGFWVRSFQQIPEPEPFVEQYLSRPAAETKGEMIETQIQVYEKNNKIINSKVFV
jgi:hypothetical protein